MQHLRIATPARLTYEVVAVFTGDPAVSHLAVLRGASLVPQWGTIHVEPVTTWPPSRPPSPSTWTRRSLVIGAMVLGPESGAIAVLGLALVRRRGTLIAGAGRTLLPRARSARRGDR